VCVSREVERGIEGRKRDGRESGIEEIKEIERRREREKREREREQPE
jgi:hypothetical protein